MEKQRCNWGNLLTKDFYIDYHDREWGVPVHDDREHFEYLVLESFSCGLSWALMLSKREIFRHCFAGFDFESVACFTETDVRRILTAEGMIHSPRKVAATVSNAQQFVKIRHEWGTFDNYIWSFTKGKTLVYETHARHMPVRNALSDIVSKDMKEKGFKYVGSIIIYSHLQAIGVINDHQIDCFRYGEVNRNAAVRFVKTPEI